MATMKGSAAGPALEHAATGFTVTGGSTTQKVFTVEDTSVINQDVTTDATPTFAGVTIDAITITDIVTTVEDSDAKLPTAGAIVDYVAGVTLPFTTEAATPVTAAVNKGYISALAAAGPQVYNLPATFAIGATIEIVGQGTEQWKLVPDAADFIRCGALITKAGGYLQSNQINDCIKIRGAVANSVWEVISGAGAYTIEIS